MKNFTLTAFLLLFFSVGAFAQQRTTQDGWLDFDWPPVSGIWISYDTSHANNVWQIGKPNKTVFKDAYPYSKPNCMVTDTLKPYPVNDTSVFIIGQIAQNWEWPTRVGLDGYFQVNSDTITDYGTIEISPNNGLNWIDILNDSLYHFLWQDKPILSGSSNGWKHFTFDFRSLAHSFNVHYRDTVLVRFSFISDSIQTNKDGLMYDYFNVIDEFEGIPTINTSRFTSSAFPNPSSSFVNISFESNSSHSYSLSVYDCSGRIIRRMEKIKEHKLTLTTNDLPPGMYHYTIRDEQDGKYSDGKFTVIH